jgi:hypothetical protein
VHVGVAGVDEREAGHVLAVAHGVDQAIRPPKECPAST